MTKGPASEGALGDLHNKVAKVMTRALDQIETQQELFDQAVKAQVELPEDADISPVTAPELNPALLSVMVRFLDSNKITCAPENGNAMSDLERKLAEKRQRRKVGNVVHLHDE